MEIPKLDFSVKRPVLEQIPELDVSTFSEIQKIAIYDVIEAYNINLARLVSYAEELESINAIKIKYVENVITILNEVR